MRIVKEFRDFIARGNVLDLAVAVIIGAAFTNIVTTINRGVLMPIVGAVMPGGDWRNAVLDGPIRIEYGAVLAATVDFLLTALVLFLLINKLVGTFWRKEEAPKAPPEDVVLLGEIRDLLKARQR